MKPKPPLEFRALTFMAMNHPSAAVRQEACDALQVLSNPKERQFDTYKRKKKSEAP